MVEYSLGHLTQASDQDVSGPIQDDEALLLYSVIRTMRLKRILEIGGLSGYSAKNFLEAVGDSGTVYTVDINKVDPISENHKTIMKDAVLLYAEDLDNRPIDLMFFDCHLYKVQMELFFRLKKQNIITNDTILVLHDTNLHPKKFVEWSIEVDGGFVHQNVERQMVDDFRNLGYDGVCFHTSMNSHGPELPFRHGLTIMKKYRRLGVTAPFGRLRHYAAMKLAEWGLRRLQW